MNQTTISSESDLTPMPLLTPEDMDAAFEDMQQPATEPSPAPAVELCHRDRLTLKVAMLDITGVKWPEGTSGEFTQEVAGCLFIALEGGEALVIRRPETLEDFLVREVFTINSAERVDWWLGVQAAIASEIALIESQCATAVNRLNAESERLDYRHLPQVRAFHLARVEEEKGKSGVKSFVYPHGTIATKTVPGRLELADPAVAIEYAKKTDYERFVELEEKFKAGDYKVYAEEVLKTEGTVLPGIAIIEEYESMNITHDKTTKKRTPAKRDKKGASNGKDLSKELRNA